MWIMLGLKRSLFHGSSLVELRMQSVSPFSTAAKATRTPTTTPMIQQWRKSLATGWKLMSICSSLPMRQQPHHHSMPTATSAPPLHPFPRNKTTAIPDKVMVEEDSPHDSNWASHMEKDPNQGGGGGEDGADEELPRTSVLLALTDRVGVLHDVLRYFWKYNVNICRIESRPLGVRKKSTSTSRNIAATASAASADPGKEYRSFDFFVDFEGSTDDANVRQLLQDLGGLTDQLLLLDAKSVHWFPRHISELDRVAHRTLDAGVDLQSTDHPGFHDPVYRSRRGALAQLSAQHTWDQPIAHVTYTPEETSVWNAVWHQMEPLWDLYACKEYRSALHEMSLNCGYSQDTIPQQQSISEYLQRRTGFRMRPVPGLLSSRDFLNGLAFRVFFCTQYMRHHSQPLYTPEPDLCHELLGHAPMLADPDFADFSQEIGLASLGASDDEVTKLAHVSTVVPTFRFNKSGSLVEETN